MTRMLKVNNLSKNQQIVLDIIEKAKGPLKAYSILFNVQKKGIKAPPQIYRALDKLIKIGKIHKIESKNAFVACRSSNCEISKATAFSICESCEMVDEISDVKLSKYLSGYSDKKGMKFKKFNLEFFGLCKKCR
jgi:Fur family zinc uptake transcriptional regulator